MFRPVEEPADQTAQRLASGGYWPARAAILLAEGKFSRAVEICNANLAEQPDLISGRLILAKALLKAGQVESAVRQFSRVLARDADNLVALKSLGDIKFAEGERAGAMALYGRILEIDPDCRGIRSPLKRSGTETTRTITLKRARRSKAARPAPENSHTVEFFTETIGDLYLQQGHHRLAAQVFQAIAERNSSPRIADKLAEAEQSISDKDH